MTKQRLSLLLFKTIEYDATEGKDLFRVTCASEWMEKEALQRLLGSVDVGSFDVEIINPAEAPRAEKK